MTNDSPVRRRLFLADPGDQPLLSSDPVEYLDRFDRFVDATGVAPERVLATPVVNVPIPVPVRDHEAEGDKVARWSGVNPDMMWLPLFWLPPHLALRYRLRVTDEITGELTGETEVESDEAWAVRVMLELTFAGLFDPTDGTWADVLSAYGIDSDNPVDQARIQLWLDGRPDGVLDSIDLTAAIERPEDPEWGVRYARDLLETLLPAQWCLSASGLLTAVVRQLQQDGNTDESRRHILRVIGATASHSLHSIPADDDGLRVTDVIDGLVAETDNPASSSEELMDAFLQTLAQVAEDYRPYADAVAAAWDGQEGQVQTPRSA